jgi:phytoene/squalene synthetase
MLLRRFPQLKSCFIPSFSVCRHKSDTNQESSSQYCLDLVKKYDYEGFISALLVPDAPQRTTVIALRAFNVEVSAYILHSSLRQEDETRETVLCTMM